MDRDSSLRVLLRAIDSLENQEKLDQQDPDVEKSLLDGLYGKTSTVWALDLGSLIYWLWQH